MAAFDELTHSLTLCLVEMYGANWKNAHVRMVMKVVVEMEANMTLRGPTRWELVVGQCILV